VSGEVSFFLWLVPQKKETFRINVKSDQDDFRVDECLDFLCKEKILTLQN